MNELQYNKRLLRCCDDVIFEQQKSFFLYIKKLHISIFKDKLSLKTHKEISLLEQVRLL